MAIDVGAGSTAMVGIVIVLLLAFLLMVSSLSCCFFIYYLAMIVWHWHEFIVKVLVKIVSIIQVTYCAYKVVLTNE